MAEQQDRSGVLVPYITAWSEEQPLPTTVVELSNVGIMYSDEAFGERDQHGVLWRRIASQPGQGEPEFGRVHSLRQRRAMRRLLCQVCAQPADPTDQGVLWLLPDHPDSWTRWPEDHAPTGLPALCPHRPAHLSRPAQEPRRDPCAVCARRWGLRPALPIL